jgi:hypothetical protein
MKKILVAAALLAAMSFAQEGGKSLRPAAPSPDSAKRVEFKRDSLALPALPDSIKAKIEARKLEVDAKRAEYAVKDSAKRAENKLGADSLRKTWEAKRDSQVAKIKNDSARAKVEARIEKIGEKKAAVKAKVDAKKAKIEARKAAKPEAPAAE